MFGDAGDPESQAESETGRVEAFSDGVLAVIITIMALELRAPLGGSFADLRARRGEDAASPHRLKYKRLTG